MQQEYGVVTDADASDWNGTQLSAVAHIDTGLRCQICKDYYTSPVMTSCCHTFCSLCIRRCLAADHQCPICRMKEQEDRLRKNSVVEELLESFLSARSALLQLAEETRIPVARSRVRKRKRAVDEMHGKVAAQDERSEEDAVDLKQDEVECPVCERPVKEAEINSHLDKCMMAQSSSSQPNVMTEIPTRPQRASPTMQRLPKISYALYNETKLRAKLAELGIPMTGSKSQLEKRHTEWLNIWNANTDAKRPRPRRELLRDLDTWEKTILRNNSPVTKIDATEWTSNHRGDFDRLVREAQQTRKKAFNDQSITPE